MEIQNWQIVLSTTLVGVFTAWGFIKVLSILAKKPNRTILIKIRESITQVLYFFLPSLFATIGLGVFGNKAGTNTAMLFTASEIMLVGIGTWLAIRIVIIFEKLFLSQLDLNKTNNNQERKLFTKIKFIKRLIIIFILILSGSLLLLSFEAGRKFGLGILTSAGIVSVIVGFAAQKTIANLLAGIQIAFTQPIKIEDVVIVEGEWGRIEEINLTYVVVVIWDLRRMVLPITYFIEKPFQNWTRKESNIIGSAFFYLDYKTPVAELRAFLMEILGTNPLWDGETAAFQVTDTKDQYIVLRAIMSARNASDAFDLRCEVREQMIEYIRTNHPSSLPVFPVQTQPDPNKAF